LDLEAVANDDLSTDGEGEDGLDGASYPYLFFILKYSPQDTDTTGKKDITAAFNYNHWLQTSQ
jgi:hypothetical protein